MQVMPALGHVDDVLAMQGVDGLAERGAGLLRAETVLVVLEGHGVCGLRHGGQLLAVLRGHGGFLIVGIGSPAFQILYQQAKRRCQRLRVNIDILYDSIRYGRRSNNSYT